jgi:hypothetical protein
MGRLRVIWCQIQRFMGPVGSCWSSIDYVLVHIGFMGSCKLSSLNSHWVGRHPTVLHEWLWDSVGATHGCPMMYRLEDLNYGTVGLARLFNSHQELCPLVVPVWPTCVMLWGCYLVRCILIRISMTPYDMGEACSLCSNVEVQTPLCSSENYVNDIATWWSRIWWQNLLIELKW